MPCVLIANILVCVCGPRTRPPTQDPAVRLSRSLKTSCTLAIFSLSRCCCAPHIFHPSFCYLFLLCYFLCQLLLQQAKSRSGTASHSCVFFWTGKRGVRQKKKKTCPGKKQNTHTHPLPSPIHCLLEIALLLTNESLKGFTPQSLSSDAITVSEASKRWVKPLP